MGTGIERMRNAVREAGVAEPEFVLDNFFKVTFKRSPTDTLGGSQAVASGRKRYSSDTQATLSDRKVAIISYLEEYGRATSSDIATAMGVTNNWVRTILRQMVDKGTVEKIGDNRYAYYVLK
jgi:predicted HTH transcriptional regulator